MCYAGSYFDPNEKTCKWVGADKVNCEELVEGYESPVAGVQSSNDDEDEDEDEDITDDMGAQPANTNANKKKDKKSSSSSKSIAIVSRSMSEYETCGTEKSVDFDPVQGNWIFACGRRLVGYYLAFYRYALLLLRKSEGEQRLSSQSESDNDDYVRDETTTMLQQKINKHRR